MPIWLLIATVATAAVAVTTAGEEAAIMVALDNGTSLRFRACQNQLDAVTLFTAPTLGDEAFSVAWQPNTRSILFSRPVLGKSEACSLERRQQNVNQQITDVRLSTSVSTNGSRLKVDIVLSGVPDGTGKLGSACHFEASVQLPVSSAPYEGADADSASSSMEHLLALAAFDGCAMDETPGGGFHCFRNWTMSACDSASSADSRSRVRRATCSLTDCQNGGICNNITSSPTCICPLPFIAPYCKAFSDYCNQQQPDLNITSLPVCINGTCAGVIPKQPYFNCICTPGFEGVRCDKEINECAANPCVNGICLDGFNNYSCSCYKGWEGRNCTVNIDDCLACPVRERCIDGNGTCGCVSGWMGLECNITDYCARGSCPNGTSCFHVDPPAFECRAAATFAYGQSLPSPTAWRLSPSGGLAEPLTSVFGWLRTRQANTNSSESTQFLTVSRGDRKFVLAVTPSGRLVASVDNQTATVTPLFIANSELFRFNLTMRPGSPLSLTVFAFNNDSSWFAQSADILPNVSLTLDSVAIVTLGDGFKGCLDGVRLNNRLLPMSNWSLPEGYPGFVRYVDWPANQSAPTPPLIGCYGDPVCSQDPQPACLNSGRCVDLWNSRSCYCTSGYSGPACGVANCAVVPCAAAIAGVSTPVVVTLCVLALIIVVVVIVVVLVKLTRNRRSETGQYRPSKEEINHGNKTGTLSVLRPPVEERLI